jgi:hypothetical protein
VRGPVKHAQLPFTTRSGEKINDEAAWQRARNQQRNWDTINQIISLRCLPENISVPCHRDGWWDFEFDVTDLATLGHDTEPLYYLHQDAEGVPMIVGLDELQELPSRIAVLESANTVFELVTS